MTDQPRQLPWEDLRRTEGSLPWPALEAFIEAVVSDPNTAGELFAEYEKAWQAVDVPTYVDLYVPAIFALAAPRLGDQQRREIGGWLVDKLIEAGLEEAELAEEILLSAAGAMGPVILPKVLDMLEDMPQDDSDDSSDARSQCWSLTALAAQTDDADLRERTARACLRLLEQIEQGQYEEYVGISAAWTLAHLKYADAAPLLQRLSETADRLSGGADYEEALKVLQGSSTPVYEEAWEWPVRERLESLWRTAKKWDAEGASAGTEEEQEAAALERARELADRFMTSPLAEHAYQAPDQEPITPPIPIVENSPKIGRNDPCPCGSGKKYKKCCGNPAKGQTTSV